MRERLRVLIVEDSEDDAVLMVRELTRAGYEVTFEQVQNPAEMQAALAVPTWDVILCDYVLPQFNAREALKLYQGRNLDLPFIVISGVLGEYIAAETIKAGAHEYLLKRDLERLPAVVGRACREAQVRREARLPRPRAGVPWLKRLLGAGS